MLSKSLSVFSTLTLLNSLQAFASGTPKAPLASIIGESSDEESDSFGEVLDLTYEGFDDFGGESDEGESSEDAHLNDAFIVDTDDEEEVAMNPPAANQQIVDPAQVALLFFQNTAGLGGAHFVSPSAQIR